MAAGSEALIELADVGFEEELARNPYSVSTWWAYAQSKDALPRKVRRRARAAASVSRARTQPVPLRRRRRPPPARSRPLPPYKVSTH